MKAAMNTSPSNPLTSTMDEPTSSSARAQRLARIEPTPSQICATATPV